MIKKVIAEQNKKAIDVFGSMIEFVILHTGISEKENIDKYLASRDEAILNAVLETIKAVPNHFESPQRKSAAYIMQQDILSEIIKSMEK